MNTQDTHNAIKIILTVSLALSFLVNSVLFTREATRRGADDVVKINVSKNTPSDTSLALTCKNKGGTPQYYGSSYTHCEY